MRGAATVRPREFALDDAAYPVARILETADLPLRGADATPELIARAADSDSAVRYWAVAGLAALHADTPEAVASLHARLEDASGDLRAEAARELRLLGESEALLPVLEAALDSPSEWVQLRAMIALDELGETARPLLPRIKEFAADKKAYPGRVARHIVAVLQAQ